MERLTTRNIAGIAVFKESYNCERCGEGLWRLPDYGNGSPTDKLADYEEAEEQGLLLRLPCKVGDRVYDTLFNYSFEITKIELCHDGKIWFRCGNKETQDYAAFELEDFGERWVLKA